MAISEKKASGDLGFKVLILKDVGGGTDESEAYLRGTSFAGRKSIAVEQHHFVFGTVLAAMVDLVDSCFPDGFSREEEFSAGERADVRAAMAPALMLLVDAKRQRAPI